MDYNELKLLLTLNSNERLPHMEEEIFADSDEIIHLYLYSICKATDWYLESDVIDDMIFFYARYTLQSRWPAAEATMKRCCQRRYYFPVDSGRQLLDEHSHWAQYSKEFGIDNE